MMGFDCEVGAGHGNDKFGAAGVDRPKLRSFRVHADGALS